MDALARISDRPVPLLATSSAARRVILSAAKNLASVATRPRFFAALRMTAVSGPIPNSFPHVLAPLRRGDAPSGSRSGAARGPSPFGGQPVGRSRRRAGRAAAGTVGQRRIANAVGSSKRDAAPRHKPRGRRARVALDRRRQPGRGAGRLLGDRLALRPASPGGFRPLPSEAFRTARPAHRWPTASRPNCCVAGINCCWSP